jgi:protein-disulfide isomerase
VSKLTIPISAKDHFQGNIDADCSLVEYGDYECPHCGHAYPLLKRVQKHYGNRLCFVYRNFPLNEMHPHAEGAAETAEFAGTKGKFWEMHDLLFENQEQLGVDLYVELAGELGLAQDELAEALDKSEFQAHVKADFIGGVRSGVNGTPTLFINGQRHNGPVDFETLVEKIDAVLGRG